MPRSLLAAAVAVASITAVACGGASPPGPGAPPDPEGPLGAAATVTLDDGESFVSVSPSGALLLTVAQPHPAAVADLCTRSGPGYEENWCVRLDDGGGGTWSPAWTDDESQVAFVRAGSRRAGESNDVVWVLDLDRRAAAPVTPTDAWLPGTPVPFWIAADRLGYLWPTAEGTLVRAGDPARGAAETLADLGDAELEVVLGGTSPLFFGTRATRHGLFRLEGDALTLVLDTGVDNGLSALSPSGEWAVVSLFDVHGQPPPELVALAGGSRTGRVLEAGRDDRYVADAAFSTDSTLVATLTIGDGTAGIELRRVDDLEVISSTELAVPPDTAHHSGIIWTAAGLVLPTSTDGQPDTVTVVPVVT